MAFKKNKTNLILTEYASLLVSCTAKTSLSYKLYDWNEKSLWFITLQIYLKTLALLFT